MLGHNPRCFLQSDGVGGGHRLPGNQPGDFGGHELVGFFPPGYSGAQAASVLDLNEIGKVVVVFPEVLERIVRNLVQQNVFEGFGGKANFPVHQQAKLAEDFTLADPVVEFSGAPIDLYCTTAYVEQPAAGITQFQNLAPGLEVNNLYVANHPVEQFLGHLVERRVLSHVIADVDQLGLHKTPCSGEEKVIVSQGI